MDIPANNGDGIVAVERWSRQPSSPGRAALTPYAEQGLRAAPGSGCCGVWPGQRHQADLREEPRVRRPVLPGGDENQQEPAINNAV